MSATEPKTYTAHQFALAMGLGNRKFMDALREGTIPAPLNPTAKKVAQFRWASGTVAAFLGGTYKGPMLPAGHVPPPVVPASRVAAAPAPAPAKANQEPERLPHTTRTLFDLLGADTANRDITQTMQVTQHRDGSVTLSPIIPNKN